MEQYPVTDTLGFLVGKLHQRNLALYRELMAERELTPAQYRVVAALGNGPPGTNQKQLGDRLQIDRATLSGILERTEKLGYVARSPDPNDRRAMLVTLTDKGATLLSESWPLTLARNQAVLAGLPPDERATFMRLLGRLLEQEAPSKDTVLALLPRAPAAESPPPPAAESPPPPPPAAS